MNYVYVNIIITTTWCPSIDFYEMRLRLLTAATNGHIVHPPNDMSFDSDGGMISTGENQRTRTKTCLSATWTDPGANSGLPGERPATNRLSHGTALTQSFSSHVTTSYRFYCSKPWLRLWAPTLTFCKSSSSSSSSCQWGETYVSELRPPTDYCSFPGWYVSVEGCGDDTGWAILLTQPPSPEILPAETSGSRRNVRRSENFAYQYLTYINAFLTGRKILRHGTSGFTSHPKESVLQTSTTLKNPSPWPGSNLRPLGQVTSTLTTTPPTRLLQLLRRMFRRCLYLWDGSWSSQLRSASRLTSSAFLVRWHSPLARLVAGYSWDFHRSYLVAPPHRSSGKQLFHYGLVALSCILRHHASVCHLTICRCHSTLSR
jgi:hypothetical protein